MRNHAYNNKTNRLYIIIPNSEDNHLRIAHGDQFSILGGGQAAHQQVILIFLKVFETLKQQGKSLEQIEANELDAIIKQASKEI